MADIERLPCGVEHELRADAAIIRSWIDVANGPINREALADRLDRYAHAAAELTAEIERLRKMHQDAYQRGLQAGSKGLREMYDAVQTVKRQDAWGNAQLTEALMEAEERAERAEAENKQLRAEVGELHMHAKRRDQYAVEKAAQALDWKKRAEQLEEVLREAQPFIGWTGSYPELHAKIDALLRDQEEGK